MIPEPFHPLVTAWFTRRFRKPTEAQIRAWPEIAAGKHVLVTAPTGSGKTLTAFLWALNQLICGQWQTGCPRVLYVSPLKALNNDVRLNLLAPLAEMGAFFHRNGAEFPEIRVLTRSGDTPSADRRRMLRHPPDILITTPESLNLLLSSAGGRTLLTGLKSVILDEIHAVIGNKRGVHLMSAVERLVHFSGEFQRIALSATVRPPATVAAFVGGFHVTDSGVAPRHQPRPVAIVASAETKAYGIRVARPSAAGDLSPESTLWEALADEIRAALKKNRATLVFANSRRLCERLAFLINDRGEGTAAYAHHGSLSREIRHAVEQRLKTGGLKAIVATHSLELGIDIGALDEVILIQCPRSVSSAVQRVGRAGHRVGSTSKGTLYPIHPMDEIASAVMARAIVQQDLEPVVPVECPLDVLAQILVSMIGSGIHRLDHLFDQLRAAYPFRNLSYAQFDLVLRMLDGYYADSRIRELKPRISIDATDNSATLRRGALQALYASGGTIPDRGYYRIRHQETGGTIGELDEEFVWEASPGQRFTLGTQNWLIRKITHNDVLVEPAPPGKMAPPFWKADAYGRDFHFSSRVGSFLEMAEQRLEDAEFPEALRRDYHVAEETARHLVEFLKRQRQHTGAPLPHRHHLLVEWIERAPGGAPGNQIFLHTLWGGKVNRPYALALEAAWIEALGHPLETYAADDGIALVLPHRLEAEQLMGWVTPENVERLLRMRLEKSGIFGAAFRHCAGRALLLTRRRADERLPLWLTRLRSQKLLDAVSGYRDFPILLEAWRTCLKDAFDMGALMRVLDELERGVIWWSATRCADPSPMARTESWRQINQYMYREDGAVSEKTSSLSDAWLREVVFSPGLRPAAAASVIAEFEKKRQLLQPGYAPSGEREILDWVRERLLIPLPEWEELVGAVTAQNPGQAAAWIEAAAPRLIWLHPPAATAPLVAVRERWEWIHQSLFREIEPFHVARCNTAGEPGTPCRLAAAPPPDPEHEARESAMTALGQWLSYYGPMTLETIQRTLGLGKDAGVHAGDLVDARRLVRGRLVRDDGAVYVCDAENFELLLRLGRRHRRPAFALLPAQQLAPFLARIQGLTRPERTIDGVFKAVEQLLALPVPAALWETDILPARITGYDPSWMDTAMLHGDLRWVGFEGRRIAFCFESELDLLSARTGEGSGNGPSIAGPPKTAGTGTPEAAREPLHLLKAGAGRYDFMSLLRLTGARSEVLSSLLWDAVWNGSVTNDTFTALRQGIDARFKPASAPSSSRKSPPRRRGFARAPGFGAWKGALPYAGHWFWVSVPESAPDDLDRMEVDKERARLVLQRYGILFRELLDRESPPFRWSRLYPVLRLMELSGEIHAGFFFDGIPGIQFATRTAIQTLRAAATDRIFWLNAMDPASLCGVPIPALRTGLPARAPGTHLVYIGPRVAMVARRNGRTLTIQLSPDDPRMTECLHFLELRLNRRIQPVAAVRVESINGRNAADSPYLPVLEQRFDLLVEARGVTLYRKYTVS